MSSVATLYGQMDDLAKSNSADMNWPLQLCVGNIINELLFGYHFPVRHCPLKLNYLYFIMTKAKDS